MKLKDLGIGTIIITQEGKKLRVVDQRYKQALTITRLIEGNIEIELPSDRDFHFTLESEGTKKKTKAVYYSKGLSRIICEAIRKDFYNKSFGIRDLVEVTLSKTNHNKKKFIRRVISKVFELKEKGILEIVEGKYKLKDIKSLIYRERKK